jgi:hypothetical protein
MAPRQKKAAMDKKTAAPRRQNPIKHFAEEVEEHLIEGAELATSTTSPETNALLAVEGAIVGPRVPKDKAEKKPSNAKQR